MTPPAQSPSGHAGRVPQRLAAGGGGTSGSSRRITPSRGDVTVAAASGKVRPKAAVTRLKEYRFALWQSHSDHFPRPSVRLLRVAYAAGG